jgi:hypothetical protein
MHDLEGSESEKRLSRRLFEAALQAELAEVVAEFKVRAAGVTTAEDMWAIEPPCLTTTRWHASAWSWATT